MCVSITIDAELHINSIVFHSNNKNLVTYMYIEIKSLVNIQPKYQEEM